LLSSLTAKDRDRVSSVPRVDRSARFRSDSVADIQDRIASIVLRQSPRKSRWFTGEPDPIDQSIKKKRDRSPRAWARSTSAPERVAPRSLGRYRVATRCFFPAGWPIIWPRCTSLCLGPLSGSYHRRDRPAPFVSASLAQRLDRGSSSVSRWRSFPDRAGPSRCCAPLGVLAPAAHSRALFTGPSSALYTNAKRRPGSIDHLPARWRTEDVCPRASSACVECRCCPLPPGVLEV
jgi:hypothetical protein